MREYPETSSIDLDVEAIVAVLDDAPVTSGVLFGSFARGDERSASDVDIAVEFDESLTSLERTRERLQLLAELSTALGFDEVDVVPLSGTAAELRREILADGILIYGSLSDVQLPNDGDEVADHDETMAQFDELLGDLERVV